MAERSKAPVSGTGLFGGVGSNPTPITFLFYAKVVCVFCREPGFEFRRAKKLPRLGIAPRLLQPQCRVLLLYYLGEDSPRGGVVWWWRPSATPVPTHNRTTATLAKRLMRLPRKQKVVSSNLTGGSFLHELLHESFLVLVAARCHGAVFCAE